MVPEGPDALGAEAEVDVDEAADDGAADATDEGAAAGTEDATGFMAWVGALRRGVVGVGRLAAGADAARDQCLVEGAFSRGRRSGAAVTANMW